MDVTGEVEIELFHRNDLGVATSCSATFDPEGGALGGLAHTREDVLGEVGAQGLHQADGGRALPSPSGVGVIPVTTTYFPSGWCFSRSRADSRILALVSPYNSTSSERRPISRARFPMGFGLQDRDISMSLGTGVLRLRLLYRILHFPGWSFSRKRLALSTVLCISMATVIGPTPPGTGVMKAALFGLVVRHVTHDLLPAWFGII